MKIGIILHPYGEKNPGGLGRAIFDLTSALLSLDKENEYMVFTKGNRGSSPSFPGTRWTHHPLGEGMFWLEGLRFAPKADVYVFNTPVMPVFFRPPRSVIIALDFAYLSFPAGGIWEWVQKKITRRYHGFSLARTTQIVAISEATKKDTIRFFGISEDRIHVLYLGFTPIAEDISKKIPVPEKFFLFPGVLKERKNVHRAVEAFRLFLRQNTDYALVLTGKQEGEYYERIRAYVAKEGIGQNVLFLGYVSGLELSFLYRRAQALIFPSLIEGFGFPVLEAMEIGTPVITSNVSSLPELAGEAALLVDPLSVSAIAAAMERVVAEPELRIRLIARGRTQAAHFSWEKAAGAWLVLLKQIALK